MHALVFCNTTFSPISRNGLIWLTAAELARALGYADDKAVQRIYTRHSEEFSDAMTGVVKLTTPGGLQETRIFSLRGAHLIAMFARTPVAKEFRRWVLDILDREVAAPVITPAPVPAAPTGSRVTEADLKLLRKTLQDIAAPVVPDRKEQFVRDAEHRILIDCGIQSWAEADLHTLFYARDFINELRTKSIRLHEEQTRLVGRYWLWCFKPDQKNLPVPTYGQPADIRAELFFPKPL